ncbi:MAG TPA: hypothetical protein VKH19_02520 [Gemmatimonadaceae bacterium]|nr:hypothetical protein [Gemmatimonadaceae bacterium]
MRSLKLGALGLLVVITGVMLLWATNAVPRADIPDIAMKSIAAVLVLVLASFAWDAIHGTPASTDHTDKPVP